MKLFLTEILTKATIKQEIRETTLRTDDGISNGWVSHVPGIKYLKMTVNLEFISSGFVEESRIIEFEQIVAGAVIKGLSEIEINQTVQP